MGLYSQGEGPTSDVEPEEEVTPTPSSSKAKGKKCAFLTVSFVYLAHVIFAELFR